MRLKESSRILLDRVHLALASWPDRRGWVETAGLFAAFSLAALVLGASSGFLGLALPAAAGTARLLAHVAGSLIFPALAEETLFRVLLLPHFAERAPLSRAVKWTALSLALFIVWHPLNAWLFLPVARPVFTDPVFLTLAGLLGLTCSVAYLRTGSVWPPVLIHWLVVVVWKALFGGLMWW